MERLISMILNQKTTKKRGFSFKKDISQKGLEFTITAAYIAEVRSRGFEYKECDIESKIAIIAGVLLGQVPKTGVLLCGLPGNGKTTLLKAVASAIRFYAIKGLTGDGGATMDIIDSVDFLNMDYEEQKKFRGTLILGIEDMGRENSEKVSFGNLEFPLIRLLEYRYEKQLSTFITTNLSPDKIREKYGARIADRFNEIMTIIHFKNGSFRGHGKMLKNEDKEESTPEVVQV